MLKQILVLVLLTISFSGAFAKSSKKNTNKMYTSVNTKKVKMSFDAKYYYQLSFKNRLQYLNEIHGFMVHASKRKGDKFKSAFFERLLIDFAHAEECFSGGIAYTAANCGVLPESFKINDTTLDACPAGSQRCSVGSGLGVDGRVLCYELSKEDGATKLCEGAGDGVVGGKTGIERLNEELTRCEPIRFTNSRCSALVSALEMDTKSLETSACQSAPKTCQRFKERIAKLNKYAPTEVVNPTAPLRDDDGCAEAEAKVSQQMISEKLGTENVNKKWLKLVSLSSQACGNAGDLESQLKKFGACTIPSSSNNVEADIMNNMELRAAVGSIANPGVYQVDNSKSIAFKNYFGISPVEFKKLFCDSADTKSFYKAFDAISPAQTAADVVKDVPGNNLGKYDDKILPRLFDANNFSDLKDGIQNGELKNKLSDYHTKKAEEERLRKAWLDCDAAGGSCRDGREKKTAFENYQRSVGTVGLKRTIETYVQNGQSKMDKRSRTSFLEASMGGSAYNIAKEKYLKSIEATNPSVVSAATAADRSEFKKCLDNAITAKIVNHETTFTSNYGNNSQYVNGNRNKTCRRDIVDLATRPSSTPGDVIVRIMTSSSTDNQHLSCYTSDGKIYGPHESKLGGCFKTIKLNSGNSSREYCIDKTSSYVAFGFKCNYASGSDDLGQTPEEAADAAVK